MHAQTDDTRLFSLPTRPGYEAKSYGIKNLIHGHHHNNTLPNPLRKHKTTTLGKSNVCLGTQTPVPETSALPVTPQCAVTTKWSLLLLVSDYKLWLTI